MIETYTKQAVIKLFEITVSELVPALEDISIGSDFAPTGKELFEMALQKFNQLNEKQ